MASRCGISGAARRSYGYPVLTLILGGARSGKSDLAQRLALASGRDVLFVATMEPADDEMRARVELHRTSRPPAWRTLEARTALEPAIAARAGRGDFVLIDCLTLWVSNMLIDRLGDASSASVSGSTVAVTAIVSEVHTLLKWARAFEGDVTVVSNEVGLGVVPASPLGRIYRDALGAANRIAAAEADRVYWVTAGLVLDIKALAARPVESFGEARER